MSRTQDEMTCSQSQPKAFSVPNTKAEIRKLITQLKKHHVHLVALEATGCYHYLVHSMIHSAGIAVAVVNPYRSRQFSESLGRMAKTDEIDARVLAQYAQHLRPRATLTSSTSST